jgi:hypothetical protein
MVMWTWSTVLTTLSFLDRVTKNTQISNLMKIRPLWVNLFRTDRQRQVGRRTDVTKPIVTFPSSADAHNDGKISRIRTKLISKTTDRLRFRSHELSHSISGLLVRRVSKKTYCLYLQRPFKSFKGTCLHVQGWRIQNPWPFKMKEVNSFTSATCNPATQCNKPGNPNPHNE